MNSVKPNSPFAAAVDAIVATDNGDPTSFELPRSDPYARRRSTIRNRDDHGSKLVPRAESSRQ
jgi:hypothetical protein